MKRLWVSDDGAARPDAGPAFDGGSDVVTSRSDVTSVLDEWPHDDAFCLELVMARDVG